MTQDQVAGTMTQDEVDTLLGGRRPSDATAAPAVIPPVGGNPPNPAAAISVPPLPAPSTLEQRMTPGPRPPGILNTSYSKAPTTDSDGEVHPSSLWDMNQRVADEMRQTYRSTPDLFTPEGIQKISDIPYAGWALGPTAAVANAIGSPVMKGLAAGGAGATADISELLSGGDPQKARDIHAATQILPIALGGMPQIPQGTTPNLFRTPLSEPYGPSPLPRAPMNTPWAVEKLLPPLVKSIETDQTGIAPQFTNRFTDTVQDLGPKPGAQTITAQGLYPKAQQLSANIQSLRDNPIQSVDDIWKIDQMINDQVRSSYTRDGATTDTPKLRDIQLAWRDQLDNMQPGDTSGGTGGGLDALKQFRQTYAAYSRMQDVQNIVDAGLQRDNPATSIKNGINTFLKDDRNTRGWTDDEIQALKDAGERGTIMEYMRASGSRLGTQAVGAGGAFLGGYLGGFPGALVGRELGAGLDAARAEAMRSALTRAAVGKVQPALDLLSQRVPQPGTVPTSPPVTVPTWLNRGARMLPYGPSLAQPPEQPQGLLGR